MRTTFSTLIRRAVHLLKKHLSRLEMGEVSLAFRLHCYSIARQPMILNNHLLRALQLVPFLPQRPSVPYVTYKQYPLFAPSGDFD